MVVTVDDGVSVAEVSDGVELKVGEPSVDINNVDDGASKVEIDSGPGPSGKLDEAAAVESAIDEDVEALGGSTVTRTVVAGPSTSTVRTDTTVLVCAGPGTETVSVAPEVRVTVSTTVVAAAPACVVVEPPSTGTTE